jgi:hypothetical protein
MVGVSYHGHQSLELENEALRVVVVPEAGGKIVSLFDKRGDREWLVTPAQSNPFRAWPYGTEYNPNQCGGWDEMFPTILACAYPGEGPYFGAELPDHGEAWTLPWSDAGSTGGQIALELTGRALPYRLRRSLTLHGDSMRMGYTLENCGAAAFAYLWAAHPQFACEPGARIILPDDADEVVNVLPLEWGREYGEPGTRNRWPEFVFGGQTVRQDRVAGPEKGGGRKFYLPVDEPISWGELRQPSGEWLRMSWDAGFAPYCGVWIDEGYLNKVADMAFEPATAYYDSLLAGCSNGRCATLAAGAAVDWWLRVQMGRGE